MAMPEQDGWIYYGEEPRDGLSYVCSSYVAAHWAAAGLFGDMTINGTEFVPRDLYELNFFNNDSESRPVRCQETDPGAPFCQLLGKYRMTFPNTNGVEPYSHMNEHCPTNWPSYERQDGC